MPTISSKILLHFGIKKKKSSFCLHNTDKLHIYMYM